MPKKKYSKKSPITKRQGWKQLRRKNRIKRKFRLFSLALIIFTSGTMFYGLLKVWDYFINPKAQAAYAVNLKAPLSTKESLAIFEAQKKLDNLGNWVLVNPKILVTNKSLKKAVLFNLPSDLKLNAGPLGEISLTGFGRLFQANGEETSPITFLENALEIPIDAIFFTESTTADFGSLALVYEAKGPGSDSVTTNLSVFQLIDLTVFLRGLNDSNMQVLDWDRDFALSCLERDAFLRESLRLELVNGSGSEGLVTQESAKISSLGVKVSSLRNIEAQDFEITGNGRANVLLLEEKAYRDLETVKYLTYRYGAVVLYHKDLKYPASLIIFNEP